MHRSMATNAGNDKERSQWFSILRNDMFTAELIHITKDYPEPGHDGFRRVLNELSLQVSPGETVVVTGPSGSGKSTLLNILGTLDHATSGSVMLGGQVAGEMKKEQLAGLRNRFTGFIFQMHMLLPQLTVLENVLLPLLPVRDRQFREEAHERAIGLLQRVGLSEPENRYPGQISVGECQRAAVVRALVNRPRLLLADEPTGSLDAANASVIADLLAELPAEHGCSVVMVTHDPAVAERMGTKYRLFNGKLHPA